MSEAISKPASVETLRNSLTRDALGYRASYAFLESNRTFDDES